MKILFIIPRYNLTNEKNYNYVFPLGLGYISSVIKEAGYEIDCLNLNHFEGTIEGIIEKKMNKKKYDIVCSGHTGIGYSIIEKIVRAVHDHPSSPKIIIGGALITSEPELMLKSLNPDFIVISEGEKTIVELLKCLEKNEDLEKVNGIGYRNNDGKTIFTKPREPIENLDSLPIPDFEGFGYNEKLEHTYSSEVLANALDYPRPYYILGSRSCPFQCTFCYHSIGSKYRVRSIENIICEIDLAIKKYRINCLILYDDLFSTNKERVYEFCKRIKEITNKLPEFKWSCSLWVTTVNTELLKTLKDAGCVIVGMGFESYSSKVLRSMNKPITPQQIDNAVRACNKASMPITGGFIFGDVAETKETAKETLDYWKNNGDGQLQLGFIQPYPGSAIYHHCIKKGIIKDKLDFIKNKISHTNWINMTDQMTDEEIHQLKEDLLRARREGYRYVIPSQVKKTGKKVYTLEVKCPFCKDTIQYKNCHILNRIHYSLYINCRNCNKRYYIASFLRKFEMNHYQELEFLRRNYLLARDKLLKQRL